jgi:glycosyltransferase involved in cell wall biosynthesis
MTSRLRIAVVLARELDVAGGRPAVLKSVIAALARNHDVELIRLRNVLELRSAAVVARALFGWIASILRMRPLPLQCVLYGDGKETGAVYTRLREGPFDAIYLDTVRCHRLLRAIRRGPGKIHVISDFDDLMSRRMSLIHDHNWPLATGNIAASAPFWVKHLLSGPAAGFISRYEAAALRRSESDAVALSDAVVLVSHHEQDELRRRLPVALHSRIHCIPPMMPLRLSPGRSSSHRRFIFIGSDRLLQNRAAIDCLIAMWRRLHPSTCLHIFGDQSRPVQPADAVSWHGVVSDLSEVYQPGSILLLPAPFGGGCKTKVAEAWSFGCPVLGNPAAFEGFDIAGYPLNLPEALWDEYICRPETCDSIWEEAAQAGWNFVAEHLSPRRIAVAWERVIRPQAHWTDSKALASIAASWLAFDDAPCASAGQIPDILAE